MTKAPPSPKSTSETIRNLIAHPIAKWVGVAVVVAIVALIAYRGYLSNTRYYIIQSKNGLVYEIDRKTGRTWVIRGANKTEVKELLPPPSLQVMPSTLRSKVTGQIGPSSFRGSFTGDLYNGTNWTIKDIQLQLVAQPKEGGNWSRSFREEVSIKPFTSGSVFFDIADRRDFDKFTWTITEVRGFPPD